MYHTNDEEAFDIITLEVADPLALQSAFVLDEMQTVAEGGTVSQKYLQKITLNLSRLLTDY
ncbi:MAG: hypothetical protein F4Y18_06970 [Cenarchaeum sp. SB0663_bin_5]|nr:hypothetical protein [Cenarchaeum sp. SB0663_bin_5]MYH04050.1 hypothetical protein [Cenarchaeum sp. SB0675_bin_21]MYL10970.1 hypothetical protein [Cenarchaeum sp. SB0669_bin_11]